MRNQFNYVHAQREVDYGEKKTIPGQAMTVKELIRRINAGIEVKPISGYYDNNNGTMIPRFKIRDLSDLDKAREYINSLEQKVQAAIQAKESEEGTDEPIEP